MIAIIGIDPGLTGGVAAIYRNSTRRCEVHDIPTVALPGNGLVKRRLQARDFALMLRQLMPVDMAAHVFVEQVRTMGGQNNAVQTQGSLMRTLGAIEAALDILRIEPVMVEPQSWKAHFGLKRKKDETDSKWKARSLEMARKLYPDADLPLARSQNRAEALLLAHFGSRSVA